MKTLVVFYSRTGNTKKIGEMIAEGLGADIEEIRDTVNRSGIKGYMVSGRDAMKKKLTVLQPVSKNAADYDLTIIGTPIWGWSMSVPIRTYVTENKDKFKNVAFFCMMGGSGGEKAFSEMEEIIGKKPIGTLAITDVKLKKNEFAESLQDFLELLK